MTFQFSSLAEFLAMNGHGPFVWACWLIATVVMLMLLLMPVLQTRSFFRRQRRLQRLAEKQTGHSSSLLKK